MGAAGEKHRPRDALGRGDCSHLPAVGLRGAPWGSPASQGAESRGQRSWWRSGVLVSVNWYPEHHGDLNHLREDSAPDCSACNETPLLPSAGGQRAIFGKRGCKISSVTCPSHCTCRGWASSTQPLPWPYGTSSVPPAPQGCCHINNATTCPITAFGSPERARVGGRAPSII